MSVLTALQSASLRLVGRKPNVFASASGGFEAEMWDLSNEVATDIVESHDWRALTKLNTYGGDGVTEAFDLPADYNRMPVKQEVHSGTWENWRFQPVHDLDEWIDFDTFDVVSPGVWVILEGQMRFRPAMGASETARFYYISNLYARSQDGEAKSSFTEDLDTFVLNERLLTLGIIWRWREQKRLDSSGDMENYTKAFNEEAGRDKGARILAVGRHAYPFDARLPYPGRLGS